MLGRKDYTQKELDHAMAVVQEQMAAYKHLVDAIAAATPDAKVNSALQAFEAPFFNNMTLLLDRHFVHRLRMSTGKDGNALNEVEMLCDSLLNNDGILRGINAIKFVPEESVTKLHIGDRIRLTAAEFERLAAAFFAEIKARFL